MLKWVALNKIFRALADPTRRYVIECLYDEEVSVMQLAESLPQGLPAILQHLKVLEESGLIRTQKIGRVRNCSLEPQALQLLAEWVAERQRPFDGRPRLPSWTG